MKKKNLVFVIIFPLIALFLYGVLGHFLFSYQKNVNSNSEIEPAVNTYVVTFNAGEGSTVEPVQVVSGQTITAPTAPTWTSYQFSGWFTDAECTNEFNFATQIQSDITLYAKWIEIYTVSYETNGGSALNSVTVTKEQKITAPTITRSGYEFIGWYTNALYTQKYNFATPVTSNLKLFACWAYILTDEDCTFDWDNNYENYGITKYDGNHTELVIIPRTYNGLPVTFIGDSAFDECELTQIVIPNNIIKVGKRAIRGCEALTTVYCEMPSEPEGWDEQWLYKCKCDKDSVLWQGQW